MLVTTSISRNLTDYRKAVRVRPKPYRLVENQLIARQVGSPFQLRIHRLVEGGNFNVCISFLSRQIEQCSHVRFYMVLLRRTAVEPEIFQLFTRALATITHDGSYQSSPSVFLYPVLKCTILVVAHLII